MIILLHQKRENQANNLFYELFFIKISLISYDFNFNVTSKYRLSVAIDEIMISGNRSYREALEDISTSLEPHSLQKCIA